MLGKCICEYIEEFLKDFEEKIENFLGKNWEISRNPCMIPSINGRNSQNFWRKPEKKCFFVESLHVCVGKPWKRFCLYEQIYKSTYFYWGLMKKSRNCQNDCLQELFQDFSIIHSVIPLAHRLNTTPCMLLRILAYIFQKNLYMFLNKFLQTTIFWFSFIFCFSFRNSLKIYSVHEFFQNCVHG